MARQFEFTHDDSGAELARIAIRGRQILARPIINRGTAFTIEERRELGLTSVLPPGVVTLEQQSKRVYEQYRGEPDALRKHTSLMHLQDRNEILFYRVLSEHLEEMLPVVYTPTIGEAIQKFSHFFQTPRGVFCSIDDPDAMAEELLSYGVQGDDVDLIVVTDSEGILGIGDQGDGGVRITVGKLAVYTAAAGVHPLRVLPVVLDVGTDNMDLLSDDSYLGVRHSRVRGEAYDAFIEKFVGTVRELFPHALIHWEDFGAANAHRILDTYRDSMPTFNDDIQGTAAVVVAAALAAVRARGELLSDQRVVIFGAGTAGIGIADLMCQIMANEGTETAAARERFWALGSRGLLREGVSARPFQAPYTRSAAELSGWSLDRAGEYRLADVVRNVRPTILIGTSAQPGAFTEQIVREMASHVSDPIILPLSNPTSLAEAVPADLLAWTDGRAQIATGSPFGPVSVDGVVHEIAQANNALLFPGIGLGSIVCRASRISDGMIAAATEVVAGRPIPPAHAGHAGHCDDLLGHIAAA